MTDANADPVSMIADRLAAEFARRGSRRLFGLPGGGSNLAVIGAGARHGLEFTLAHTEYAAAVMAAVYGQLTGTPTGCVVTRGPGAAAVTNGVAQAFLDRQPLVLLTDTVSARDRPRVPHQQIDQQALFRPLVKASLAVGATADAGANIGAALDITLALPHGPVHIDIDPNALGPAPRSDPRSFAVPTTARDVAQVAALLGGSRQPCALLGMGAPAVSTAVRAFLRDSDIPVLSTYRAIGVIPDAWPEHAGTFTGATSEADVLGSADLILAIGVDQVELIPNPWPYTAPVVTIASWDEHHEYFSATHTLIGDIPSVLDALPRPRNDDWPGHYGRDRVDVARAALRRAGPRSPQAIVESVQRAAPARSVATVDAGAHMLAALSMWRVEEPMDLLVSTGLATMGFALPAAIAASLANPHRHVVCLVGDGGLSMVEAELETIARLDLPISIVVFNDDTLSLIALKQTAGQGGDAAIRYRTTNFAALARAHGLDAIEVGWDDDLEEALTKRFATPSTPVLLDVAIDPADYRLVMSVTRGSPLVHPDAE